MNAFDCTGTIAPLSGGGGAPEGKPKGWEGALAGGTNGVRACEAEACEAEACDAEGPLACEPDDVCAPIAACELDDVCEHFWACELDDVCEPFAASELYVCEPLFEYTLACVCVPCVIPGACAACA